MPLTLPRKSIGTRSDFWESKSVEELAREQGVKPVEDPNDLKGDFWPEAESVDEFLAWLRAQRQVRLAPFTGLARAAVMGPPFRAGGKCASHTGKARSWAFSLCGFRKAPRLKPTSEKPRERGSGYVWRSRDPA